MQNIQNKGFSVVELIIVVVVIAILATIGMLTYNNLIAQAKIDAMKVAINQASKMLQISYTKQGLYPDNITNPEVINVWNVQDTQSIYQSNGKQDSTCLALANRGLGYKISWTPLSGIKEHTSCGEAPICDTTPLPPSDPAAQQTYCVDTGSGKKWSYPIIRDGNVLKIGSSWQFYGEQGYWSWDGSGDNYNNRSLTGSLGKTASQMCEERGNNWRLPTIDELSEAYQHGLVTFSTSGNPIYNWTNHPYIWSSSKSNPSHIWRISLNSGEKNDEFGGAMFAYVLCVR